ncbi:MAG TPA: thioredoxin family protein [Bellilinea sp.]|nr:thioredoxin family protein [Bellilinea sp.]
MDKSSFEIIGPSVKVLGSGCAKCYELERNALIALKNLGINVEIEHVKDFAKTAAYGVMSTPALVINEKVVSSGRVLKPQDIEKLLSS